MYSQGCQGVRYRKDPPPPPPPPPPILGIRIRSYKLTVPPAFCIGPETYITPPPPPPPPPPHSFSYRARKGCIGTYRSVMKLLANTVYFPHPVPQSYQSISPPDFLALCPSKLYVVRFAAASFQRPGTAATLAIVLIYRTCIIVEINGSEISLYTA